MGKAPCTKKETGRQHKGYLPVFIRSPQKGLDKQFGTINLSLCPHYLNDFGFSINSIPANW
jgi:hypothetical protein